MDLVALLYSLGLSANYTGFHCIIAAVEIAVLDPRSLTMVTKSLYPQAALRCKMSWKAVERNIRFSIDMIWDRDPHKLQQVTGFPVPTKPTVAQFIAILAHASQSAAQEQSQAAGNRLDEEPASLSPARWSRAAEAAEHGAHAPTGGGGQQPV